MALRLPSDLRNLPADIVLIDWDKTNKTATFKVHNGPVQTTTGSSAKEVKWNIRAALESANLALLQDTKPLVFDDKKGSLMASEEQVDIEAKLHNAQQKAELAAKAAKAAKPVLTGHDASKTVAKIVSVKATKKAVEVKVKKVEAAKPKASMTLLIVLRAVRDDNMVQETGDPLSTAWMMLVWDAVRAQGLSLQAFGGAVTAALKKGLITVTGKPCTKDRTIALTQAGLDLIGEA